MVCIEKRPYTLYGRLATLHFRYLTCLLDRGHITQAGLFYGVLQLQTVGSAPALSERTPEGSSELSTAAHFHERERV